MTKEKLIELAKVLVISDNLVLELGNMSSGRDYDQDAKNKVEYDLAWREREKATLAYNKAFHELYG